MPEFDAASLLQDATPEELATSIPQDEAADRVTASAAFIVTDQSGKTVGHIAVPDDFCPLDGMGACDKDPDHRHLASFHNVDGWWVHMACGRPTKAWWESHLRSVVTFRG
jgi:hypothetical protein